MSKRDLKKYLADLSKEQLQEQFLDMYDKFSDVKIYYDFVFHPNEEKRIQEAKFKISNEYFPLKGKRPKLRRSTAQKYIKHFKTLGIDPYLLADLMLYNMEIAQTYTAERTIKQEVFYKSMLSSLQQSVAYMIENGILIDFQDRVVAVAEEADRQHWVYSYEFTAVIERLEY